jgi:hypothetical protein
MAILGDLGKVLGLGTGGEFAADTASKLGVTNPVTLQAIETSGDKISSYLSGGDDVSGPPAGVDSPATLTRTSQTSSLGGPTGDGSRTLGGGQGMRNNQAFIGGFGLPGLLGQAGRLLSKPGVGGALTGFGGALGFDLVTDMFGNTKKLVITRKLQREVKKVFMMSGGDIGFVSMNSTMLFGKDLSADQILMILFKTFKNQGPYVTKAAVRKTRSTIRKMETLCDLKDRLCPPKRAAPRRRTTASTTKVLQVK